MTGTEATPALGLTGTEATLPLLGLTDTKVTPCHLLVIYWV